MNEKKVNSNEKLHISKKTYLVTAAVYVVVSVLLMWNDGIFDKESAREVMGSISNGFFISGGLFAGVGALSLIGAKGTYDTLSYGVTKIGIQQLIPGLPKDIPESFYEYRKAKEEKGRTWFPNLLFTGLAGILLSALFVAVYSFMQA